MNQTQEVWLWRNKLQASAHLIQVWRHWAASAVFWCESPPCGLYGVLAEPIRAVVVHKLCVLVTVLAVGAPSFICFWFYRVSLNSSKSGPVTQPISTAVKSETLTLSQACVWWQGRRDLSIITYSEGTALQTTHSKTWRKFGWRNVPFLLYDLTSKKKCLWFQKG